MAPNEPRDAPMADDPLVAGGSPYTGRHLVLADPDELGSALSAMRLATGSSAADEVSAAEVDDLTDLPSGLTVVYPSLGVALVVDEPDSAGAILTAAAASPSVVAVEPERYVRVLEASTADYLAGYRDGVQDAIARLERTVAPASFAGGVRAAVDETRATWGLQVTGVLESCLDGRGVRIAVLDTGVDAGHPDFRGAAITSASFVQGQDAADRNGHGTHCIGTVCGPRAPASGPRYGIAPSVEVYAGKVLGDNGSGTDGTILAGIEWAISNGCAIVSMSLGAPTTVGQRPSAVFEEVAARAERRGTLVVAAAGNSSRRPGYVAPVNHPANCPSVLAVAAVDSSMAVAPFSCAGLTGDGGQVDIAGPGVNVLSTAPGGGYRTLSGTSMATPHVAGVLALLVQQRGPGPGDLKNIVQRDARRLNAASTDVGAGLVQAAR